MTLAAGSRLGPYEIVALLGAGGMGEVYRSRVTLSQIEYGAALMLIEGPVWMASAPPLRRAAPLGPDLTAGRAATRKAAANGRQA